MAGVASAAPLCRDLKGLFTPCPQSLSKAAQHQLEHRIETLPAEPAATSTPTARIVPPRAAKRRRIDQGKLCKDLKGLFTPCPK